MGAAALLGAACGALRPAAGCCLTFHRAAASAAWATLPNRGFWLDLDYLERLLRGVTAAGWDVVTLDEALRRTAGSGGRRYVNFSVDDCYRDTAEAVVPLFRRLGLPVTLFVTSGIPDGTLRLRDAGLEGILRGAGRVDDDGQVHGLATDADRRRAFAAISARWDASADADAAYERFCRRHGADADQLDAAHRIGWPALERLARDTGVEIGGHTVNHTRVSALSPTEAAAEIGGCRARLLAKLDVPVRHFAFPFGRSGDCGERDFAVARASGFASASTTRKGLLLPGADPYRLPRNTLNGAHRALPYAYAHLTGVTGILAQALGRG